MVILFLWVCSSTSQRQHPAEYPSRAARSSTLQTHRLPRIGNLFQWCHIGFRGAATLPHRLPLRSIPPQRFACGSSHSRGAWSPTVCAEEFPTPRVASFAILQLFPGQAASGRNLLAKAHKNPTFVLEKPENGGSEGKKRTKIPILCQNGPKSRKNRPF